MTDCLTEYLTVEYIKDFDEDVAVKKQSDKDKVDEERQVQSCRSLTVPAPKCLV